MKVKLIVDGGAMQPGPAVAQQLGPMGINLGKVIGDVNSATSGFKGTKVPVEIDVDPKTKSYNIKVFSPPVAELIKKELGLEKGSGLALKEKVGNLAFERIIYIAKTKMPNMLAKDLKKAAKLVVGSCVSLGVLIDNKEAKEIEADIDSGKYDSLISNEVTEIPVEKKADLEKFFAARKAQQEKVKKAEEEAKAAEEAAKVAAGAVPGAPATAVSPAAAGAKAGTTPAAPSTPTTSPAKKEEAKAGKEKKEAKKR